MVMIEEQSRSELTRRGFIRHTGVGAVGAYALMGAVQASVADAARKKGVPPSPSEPTVVVQWSSTTLEAIRETHPGPPMVARALAMVHTAIFDAWAAYDDVAVGTRLGATLRRPAEERTEENKHEALSYAAYRTLVDLYPGEAERPQFDALMSDLGYDPADVSTDTTTPSGIGNTAAAELLAFRHADGSNQLAGYADTSGYVPVNDSTHINDPNSWQPLRPEGATADQRYIAPHWGVVEPFALTSGSQFRPDRPARIDDQLYRRQAEDVLRFSAKLKDEEKVIAEYWADGPASELPPGHWCLFGHHVSQRDRHGLDDDVKMFFALTNAIFDASIAAWDAKRAYNSVRPVTAIHFLFANEKVKAWAGPYQGKGKTRGGDWRPYQAADVVSPPFPEYLSGHSAFSAAGAEILRRFTGSDALGASFTQLAGTSRVEPGAVPKKDLTLRWRTFSDAADEAGISRRYGGIHFEQGDLDGRTMGRQVGAQAWGKAQQYVRGTAA